ncbi:hypothetical protein TBLA_0D01150 [Henningerozyma blattae CBS 6284]|uniref:AB hydrolase-1 domain-containing protein n=1 Tax=Henningerozyma blattae (strain ATCC 34711 / CBS 6284 / DSM 70876 / NBRC 10599 / NRRL Y-10934 / UCD 77-7) TaxID=1071380 RepID=I2H2M1_HENB6|nr:hypothetical protein TBLA_0D01150 [Tetrapisispora blattae CBS 6284]CCH60623.1 hypothetical protein TBLA_0D01150 [Tetrapisispora blattae CBS 6284]
MRFIDRFTTLAVKQTYSSTPLTFIEPKAIHNTSNNIDAISLQSLIDKHSPELSNDAKSSLHPWLVNGHLQTIYASYNSFVDRDIVSYKRFIIDYPDHGQGALDFAVSPFNDHQQDTNEEVYIPETQTDFSLPTEFDYSFIHPDTVKPSDDSKPMLIVLHGLTGGSAESYVRAIIKSITSSQFGFEACVLNSRGCCNSSITTPKLYNGGWTNDIRFAVKKLRELYPNRPFYMIGFSLGASMLANYLGEESSKSDIKCAVVMGNPWNLSRSSYYINNTPVGKWAYSPALGNNLVDLTKKHLPVLRTNIEFQDSFKDEKLNSIKTVIEFDDTYTGPLFGYKDAQDYYNDSSSYKRIATIRTPLLAINAMDDPIVGSDSLPDDLIKQNPFVILDKTSIGGHIAWFKNSSGERWYAEPICKFFKAFNDEITMKGLIPNPEVINSLPKANVKHVRTTDLNKKENESMLKPLAI